MDDKELLNLSAEIAKREFQPWDFNERDLASVLYAFGKLILAKTSSVETHEQEKYI